MRKHNLLAIRREADWGAQVVKNSLRSSAQAGDGVENGFVLILRIAVLVVNVVAVWRKCWTIEEISWSGRHHLGLAAGCDLPYPQALLIAAFHERGKAAIR